MVVTVQVESNMNKAHIQLLNQRYTEACEDYLKAFCDAYELPCEKDSWVGNDVGTIALIGDYYIDFQNMMYMLDNGIAFEEWLRWYDYSLDAHDLGLDAPNFPSWHKGCPRLTEEQIQDIKDKRQELKELIESYKKNQNVF